MADMDGSDRIRISNYVCETAVLGPGRRFAVWFQGCAKRCRGCINPEGQKLDGGRLISVEELLGKIRQRQGIQGVTVSGGEPFLQYRGLKRLLDGIKEETKLDVMLYSGYTLQELQGKFGDDLMPVLRHVDIFIDGEYRQDEDHGSIYRGSDNQDIYFFTERFRDFREEIYRTKNRDIEFSIEGEAVYMVGVPPKDFYPEFIKKISAQAEK